MIVGWLRWQEDKGSTMMYSCIDCVRKHIATADIYFTEYNTGVYPDHFWLGYGHLNHAELEMERFAVHLVRTSELTILRDMRHKVLAAKTDGLLIDYPFAVAMTTVDTFEKYMHDLDSDDFAEPVPKA